MTISSSTDGRYKYVSGIYAGKLKPMLRIANRFMIKSGFNIGSKVDVEYKDGIITITLKNTI